MSQISYGNVIVEPQRNDSLSKVDVRFSWQEHDWREWYRCICPNYDIGQTAGQTNE